VFWDIAGHFSTVIPFHPLGEPSSAIVFPNFLSSHMQGSAFLCDLCASAVKNETPTADSRIKPFRQGFVAGTPGLSCLACC
jgi:hypothetical protein